MDLLKTVNLILPKLGEHTVTSLSIKHPTLAILLPTIEATRDELTRKGWWFNTFDLTLYPDSEKGIELPVDTLSFTPKYEHAIQRGRKLYNGKTRTYLWDAPVEGKLITRVDFEELPESMASWVLYESLVATYVTDIGLEDEVQLWENKTKEARSALESEHLKNMQYSTARSGRYQRIRAAMRG